MSEFSGTPGPWSAIQNYVDEVSVIDSDGFKVVTAERTAILLGWDEKGFERWGDEGGSRHLSGPEQFANAYLIAAAPELLDALQETVKDLVAYQINARNAAKINDRWEGCAEAVQPSIDRAREAINKALGR